MRRLLVAGIAALAVVLGLCTITTGTAFAASCGTGAVKTDPTGQWKDTNGQFCHYVDGPTAKTEAVDAARRLHGNFVAPPCTVDHNPHAPGCQNTGPIYGGPRGGQWNDRLDGRYFRLDRGPALDVCDSGASNYDVWLNRNGSYRDRIVRQLNAQRWNDLRRADCGAVSVSNDGQCVTFRQDALRYGNDLNANRRDWSGLRLRLLSSHRGWNGSDLNVLSLSERNDWNRFSSLDRDRYNNYNRVYSQLRTVCSDPNPPVVIVQAPAAVTYTAPAPADNSAAAAPQSSGSLPANAPAAAPNTGGWDIAAVLAHARAV